MLNGTSDPFLEDKTSGNMEILKVQTSSWHSFGPAWLDFQMFLVCAIVSQWVVDIVCKSGSYCGWQQLCWHWPRWTRPAGSPDQGGYYWPRWTRPAGSPDQGGYYQLLAKPPSWIRKTDYFDKLLWNMSIKPEGWMNAVEIIPPVVTDVNIVKFWVESWFSFDSANS